MEPSATEVFETSLPTSGELFVDRATAAITGAAIADAMGWITEFMRSPEALERHTQMKWLDRYVSWPKNTGGRFNTYVDQINAGDYSDDTQLALCVARSIEPDGALNARYFAKVELPLWFQYARGAGATITAAARAATRRKADWNSNFFTIPSGRTKQDYRDAGANGAAMRVLPLAVANVSAPSQLAVEVWKASIVTHGHPRAIVGALVISEAARQALADESQEPEAFFASLDRFISEIAVPQKAGFDDWIARWNSEPGRNFDETLAVTKSEMRRHLELAAEARRRPIADIARNLGCYDAATKGSGTGTVALALALYYRFGGSFRSVVEQAVNLIGTDTDTVAAMAAGLAGAHGGTVDLPEQWLVKVQDFHYLIRVSDALVKIGRREAQAWDLGPSEILGDQARDITDMSRATSFSTGQRVRHPIFGLGWIRHVQTQQIRRRGGGTITLVDVEFDTGQSVRLRTRPGLLEVDSDQIATARNRAGRWLDAPTAKGSEPGFRKLL